MKAEDILPDDINIAHINGLSIRKGTVAAFLVNAKTYLNLATPALERDTALSSALEALPALQALGVFDVFIIADPALRELIAKHSHQTVR
ncbi:hypothetical protein H8L32_15975 [Undibacterium sp. CY18W]|uniref:Preprotein translocase subunit SecD n=1 Tax=Undibacterium hunanense TaxID=2762292 RepID=A0ABR6ZTL6_9BURK|nr:hypothetical protein [Undibacterium hunanense]MBC3918989.1 hypothetical protein [Undibacterium hunanense]